MKNCTTELPPYPYPVSLLLRIFMPLPEEAEGTILRPRSWAIEAWEVEEHERPVNRN